MKRLITILVSTVAAVALLVAGTAYAGKPTPTPTPTSNVIMESGSGTLRLYTNSTDNSTSTFFPLGVSGNLTSGFTGGYDGVVHVSLTYTVYNGGSRAAVDVSVDTLSNDPDNTPALHGINVLSENGILSGGNLGETVEFDAYEAWAISISLEENSPDPTYPPWVTYNYTVTYPAQ